ncbi:potassium/sodium efflux P-type ATPase [Botrytis cinerea]
MTAAKDRRKEETSHVSGQANEQLSDLPHSLTIEQLLDEIGANLESGLTASEAKARLEKYGENELDDGPGVSPVKILIRQVANAMTLVLILAMAVSFGIGSYIEGGVITAVIALNITVGFFQEFSAEKTMDSLRSMSSPTASVVRDGNSIVVPTRELVFGDLVEIKVGDTIPADIRLVETMNLDTDEALLTGESLPVQKEANSTFETDTGPGDRLNIVYSSSTVTKGRGRGVVYATGMATEIGSIATALRSEDSKKRHVKRKQDGSAKPHRYVEAGALTAGDFVGRFLGVNIGTPLQRKLSKLALLLFGIAIVCSIIVLGANKFSKNREVIIYAVATGLSMIPASLIVVLTITMAAGTRRMVDRHVVVRKLDSLEALGGITDICSDKTGTLTQGKMVVKKAWIPSKGTYSVGTTEMLLTQRLETEEIKEEVSSEKDALVSSPDKLLKDNNDLEQFLNIASLANLAQLHIHEGEWKARGDPTDIAFQVFASRFNWNRSRWTGDNDPIWAQKAEYPFDSSIKKMSVIFESAEHTMIRGQILDSVEALASQGLRVLAFASNELINKVDDLKVPKRAVIESDLVFRGLVGLYDPPRPETAGAVTACHTSGIAVHMLTGDHPSTAKAIALQVGILPTNIEAIAQDKIRSMVMTAGQFDKLSNDEVDALPLLPLVIARCSPATKVRMIESLHRRGRFVAMTGDGVNDSPSLKYADVGIAMGLAGSDVAKDASDIILTNDNFASIINAVEEGRRMFDNIQKFILHLLAENVAQALTLLIGLVFKDKSNLSVFPLAPVEILWVIMITSGMPDMGLGFEAPAPDIMSRPPHPLKIGVFTREVLLDMVVYGLWMAALCISAFSLVMFAFGDGNLGSDCNNSYSTECDTVFRARATTFVCLTWFALFLAWEMVNMRRSFFRMQPQSKKYLTQWAIDVWRNQFLFWAIFAGFVTIFPTLYIPTINHVVFKHTGISWEWGIVFVEATLFFFGVESWKWAKRIYFRRQMLKKGGQVDDLEKKAFAAYFNSE